jgi:hypothetical protein
LALDRLPLDSFPTEWRERTKDFLAIPPKFVSSEALPLALKKKYRKQSGAADMFGLLATITTVEAFRSQVLDYLEDAVKSATATEGFDLSDHLESLLQTLFIARKKRSTCAWCGRPGEPTEPRFPCCSCKGATYCSTGCQRRHCNVHMEECTYHQQRNENPHGDGHGS